jgi:hypothetical protein
MKSLWIWLRPWTEENRGVCSRRRQPPRGAGEPVLKCGRRGCSAPWTVASCTWSRFMHWLHQPPPAPLSVYNGGSDLSRATYQIALAVCRGRGTARPTH